MKDADKMAADIRRTRTHDFAFAGSVGHGTRRFAYVVMPDTKSIMPANMNNGILCCEIQTTCGNALTRLAMTAPAPTETSIAGRAQHSRVPNELRIVRTSRIIVRTFIVSVGQQRPPSNLRCPATF